MTTTITVSNETRDRLKAQAAASKVSLGEHLTRLADLADRRDRLADLRRAVTGGRARSTVAGTRARAVGRSAATARHRWSSFASSSMPKPSRSGSSTAFSSGRNGSTVAM